MLLPFYQAHLQQCLSPRHYLLINLLVLLLQWHKQVRLERLAANLPLPIQFEGHRRCLQRLFSSPQLHMDTLWLPLVSYLLSRQFRGGQTLYLVLDRRQWQGVNVLMASVIYRGRALPLYWQFLSHSGSSGLAQQQAVLQPLLALWTTKPSVATCILVKQEFYGPSTTCKASGPLTQPLMLRLISMPR